MSDPAPVRVLIPSGALGLGYDRAALERGVSARPDMIAIDGGSTDSGPAYLGRGVSKYARASLKSEWAELIRAQAKATRLKGNTVPLLIGTAGTCGADKAVDWFVEITKEILAEQERSARLAIVKSSQDPGTISKAIEQGRIQALPGAPDFQLSDLANATNIVALAGAEQIMAALETGADIIIAGRTTDTAIIAALPLMRGLNPGAAWHGAKIGECGALCTSDPQSGAIMIDFDTDGFTVTPLGANAVASPRSVMAHMLYENADPFTLHEPGGHLDVREARYEPMDDKATRVTGSRWVPSKDYHVKLEGARFAGHRMALLALLRDPHYVAHAGQWADDIIQKATEKAASRTGLDRQAFSIDIRLIGKDATFGPLENATTSPHEIGALAIVTAHDQETAKTIAQMLNPFMLHHPLTAEEELPTFAFPFSPAESDLGPHYEFFLHHIMQLKDPMEAFRLTIEDIHNG